MSRYATPPKFKVGDYISMPYIYGGEDKTFGMITEIAYDNSYNWEFLYTIKDHYGMQHLQVSDNVLTLENKAKNIQTIKDYLNE